MAYSTTCKTLTTFSCSYHGQTGQSVKNLYWSVFLTDCRLHPCTYECYRWHSWSRSFLPQTQWSLDLATKTTVSLPLWYAQQTHRSTFQWPSKKFKKSETVWIAMSLKFSSKFFFTDHSMLLFSMATLNFFTRNGYGTLPQIPCLETP